MVTSPAWKQQKQVSAREGLVAIAYERNQGEHSRVYQVRPPCETPGSLLYVKCLLLHCTFANWHCCQTWRYGVRLIVGLTVQQRLYL